MSKESAKSCRRLKEWGGQLLSPFPGRWRYFGKEGGWQLETREERLLQVRRWLLLEGTAEIFLEGELLFRFFGGKRRKLRGTREEGR